MERIVELKLRLSGRGEALAASLAALSDEPPTTYVQEDFFFAASRGRLKLRVLAGTVGELIWYERPDTRAVKQALAQKYRTSDPDSLKRVLLAGLPVTGVLKKHRTAYWRDRVEIHLDHLPRLGDFVELEVALETHEPAELGERLIRRVTAELDLEGCEVVGATYLDLLRSTEKADAC